MKISEAWTTDELDSLAPRRALLSQ